MARKTRSYRGDDVDFDLLKTKQELGEKERVLEVRDREDFVHTKRRTRGKAALIQRLNKNKKHKEQVVQNNDASKTVATSETKSDAPTTSTKRKRTIVKKDQG